jgi:hypothetical protein
MTLFKIVTTVFCAALIGAALAPQARADEWNRKTVITFSGPVEIPGVHRPGEDVLPAGTYVFKILDSQSSRHIVQIFNEAETKVLATILAIPNYRLKATDKTVITFSERPAGEPEALRAWFYPGRNWGEEFVYPKAKAMELAKTTNTPVLFVPDEVPTELDEPVKSADAPIVADLKRAPIKGASPSGEEVELAQVVTPPPAAEMAQADPPVQMAQARPATLPDTASVLPLMGLLGLLALGGAFVLRVAQRHVL